MFDDRIYTFLTLYEQMNYHRTAEKRNMTQPGVTQHIQYLEKLYGVKLFRYEGRTLHRTAQAELLKKHLESMMAEEQAMKEEFTRSEGVHLRVGATKTIGEFVLTPVVEKFIRDPAHSLEFVIDNTQVLLRMLEDRQLDFAVVEGVFDKSRYDCRLYRREEFCGICPVDHPFAGKTVPLEQVLQETLLVRETGSGTRRILEQAISDRGYRLGSFRRVISLGNFSVLMDLLVREQAVTFAYRTIARDRRDLAAFTVENMALQGEFNFIYCNRKLGEEKIAQLFGGDPLQTAWESATIGKNR